jgi:hypothetical protein
VAVTDLAPVPVPHPKQVRDLLLALTGRDVEVGRAHPVVARDPAVVAVYVTDRLGTGAIAACDLPLAAYAGGALGLVPPPLVEQEVTDGRLSPELTENVGEVLNILASVFNATDDAPHLKLHKVHPVGEKLPTDVAGMLGYVVRRVDLQIALHGYGAGRLSLVSSG